ncbi:MAG: hypothetical protein V4590_09080 [Bacteroidota bacterium]
MRIRRSKVVLILLVISTSGYSQSKWSLTFKGYASLSWFGINTQSSYYNDRWESVNLSYKPNFGYGAGIGLEYRLSNRLNIYTDIRYNQWGGHVYAIRDNPNFYFDLEIMYKSFNIPIGFKYLYKQKTKWNLYMIGGIGFDNSFKLAFIPKNQYGSVPVIEENVTIQTNYLLLGTGGEFKINGKLIGTIGIEVNNDALLNPKRIQDFGGLFGQDVIPLSYTMISLHFGIKV